MKFVLQCIAVIICEGSQLTGFGTVAFLSMMLIGIGSERIGEGSGVTSHWSQKNCGLEVREELRDSY